MLFCSSCFFLSSRKNPVSGELMRWSLVLRLCFSSAGSSSAGLELLASISAFLALINSLIFWSFSVNSLRLFSSLTFEIKFSALAIPELISSSLLSSRFFWIFSRELSVFFWFSASLLINSLILLFKLSAAVFISSYVVKGLSISCFASSIKLSDISFLI